MNKFYIHVQNFLTTTTIKPYQMFHFFWFFVFVAMGAALIAVFKKPKAFTIKAVILTFWVGLVILEILKQIYAAGREFKNYHDAHYLHPIQLCSMPLISMLVYVVVPSKFKRTSNGILSYVGILNLWSGLFVMLYPGDVFTNQLFISFQTMLYHGILLTTGLWIVVRNLYSDEFSYKTSWKPLVFAIAIFMGFFLFATFSNEIIYWANKKSSKPYHGNFFNVSHRLLSPYTGAVPALKKTPYGVFTFLYVIITIFGFSLFYYTNFSIGYGLNKLENHIVNKKKLVKEANN
ncbi:hypothetical protein ACJA25_01340 [Mycoplasmopsis hyopharyngis]|uniref:TMEM164 family acyltransferase n=1 Tax=Mycoplasmopsis hyopharyngis TaxID=29558 RepID=UPI003873C515